MIINDQNLQPIEKIETRSGIITFWLSHRFTDNEWDAFVESSNFGHFEQTSRWAVSRYPTGWEPFRILVSKNNKLIGGFQILERQQTRFYNFGLLKKGPIVMERNQDILKLMINFLKRIIYKKFLAVIVQPPDLDAEITGIMINSGFIPNQIGGIIKCANVLVNLTLPEEQIFKNMKRQKKQNIKAAQKAGIVIRQGGKEELHEFFNLMKLTCLRKGVAPNPPSITIVEKIWDYFSPDKIALFFAEYEKTIISGVLVILCGNRASLWKFGWSGEFSHIRPNDLLFWEIFKWAKSKGYEYADLGEFGSYYAKKSCIYDNLEACKYLHDVRFKTGFGGDILKLQPGLLYFSNTMVHVLYQHLLPKLINLRLVNNFVRKLL